MLLLNMAARAMPVATTWPLLWSLSMLAKAAPLASALLAPAWCVLRFAMEALVVSRRDDPAPLVRLRHACLVCAVSRASFVRQLELLQASASLCRAIVPGPFSFTSSSVCYRQSPACRWPRHREAALIAMYLSSCVVFCRFTTPEQLVFLAGERKVHSVMAASQSLALPPLLVYACTMWVQSRPVSTTARHVS